MRSGPPSLVPAIVLASSVLTGGWFLQRGTAGDGAGTGTPRLLDQVLDHVNRSYVDTVNAADVYDDAIEGILDGLGDPYSSFLKASDYENLAIRTEGEYGGVGLEIVERDGRITVVSPMPGTPGARAGIRAGDEIVEVDGTSIEGWTSDQAVELLRGRPDSQVEMVVERQGVEGRIPFQITRAVIQVRSVPFSTMLDHEVGYVPLQAVAVTSASELRAGIEALRERGMKRLVLDLRGNPGGVLDGGIGVSDLFLDRGASVVETRGRGPGQSETYRAGSDDLFADLPVVALIDQGSASAAEIIAGALQDHDRALIVGTRSFGKGLVQTLYPLSGGNVLRLTTARWYTPSGRSISKTTEEQAARRQNGALALDGRLASRMEEGVLDSVFTSAAGRPLLGGGGIVPDVMVLADTLLSDEQLAVRELFQQAGRLSVVLFEFAVEWAGERPDLQADFTLGAADLDALYGRLATEGIEADRRVFNRAGRFLRIQLEEEIALQRFGDEGEFLRKALHDLPLRAALELAREADTPAELFAAGESAPGSVAARIAAASETVQEEPAGATRRP